MFTFGLAPTTPTPLSPSFNGDPGTFLKNSVSKIDTLKNWSISTYKCTRQLMLEKLGKSARTVDSELEAQIEQLRETQRKYLQILRLTRALSSHFHHVVQTQHCLSEAFSDLAQKSPELQQEFLYNSETQRSLTKNGELLLNALNFFVSSVSTLCNKTIEDTLITIRQYELARWAIFSFHLHYTWCIFVCFCLNCDLNWPVWLQDWIWCISNGFGELERWSTGHKRRGHTEELHETQRELWETESRCCS